MNFFDFLKEEKELKIILKAICDAFYISRENEDSPFVTISMDFLAEKIKKTKREAFDILFEAEKTLFFGRSDRFPDAVKGIHPFKILGIHGLEGKSEKIEVAEFYIHPVTFEAIKAFDLIENLPSTRR